MLKEAVSAIVSRYFCTMSVQKNRLTLLLMTISILLLLVLQYFWLKSSYENEREQLRKETSSLFRITLFSIQDSLMQRKISVIPDSLQSTRMGLWQRENADSITKIAFESKEARIQVYLRDDSPDSLQQIFKPLTERMHAGQRNFIVRLNRDSLNIDSLTYIFQNVLVKNAIHVPFTIYKLKRGEVLNFIDSLYIDPVHFPPFERYSVIFPSPEPFLWKKIGPQFLFSVFLTLVTISAFAFMYRSLRTQQKLMVIKNDFISNVSHELKTPVATVSVAIEALKSFQALNNPTKTAEYLNIAQNELNRLTLMTDKILKAAVFENQGLSFQKEKVNLTEIIEEVLASLKLVIEKLEATIQFANGTEPIFVLGDRAHLTNMIYNLVDNALKYSHTKTYITISLSEKENEIVLTIQDNGIGIAPENHKKIFERFFRVSSGDVHNTKGYGLGLSYVADVVAKHGGRIKIDSALDKGSNFYIYLPTANG